MVAEANGTSIIMQGVLCKMMVYIKNFLVLLFIDIFIFSLPIDVGYKAVIYYGFGGIILSIYLSILNIYIVRKKKIKLNKSVIYTIFMAFIRDFYVVIYDVLFKNKIDYLGMYVQLCMFVISVLVILISTLIYLLIKKIYHHFK